MEDFGELRSLLHTCKPTHKDWTHLCRLIDDMDDATFRAALEYLRGMLNKWPGALKLAPTHWLESAVRGDGAPQLAIARVLPAMPNWTTEQYSILFSLPQTTQMIHFNGRGGRLTNDILNALSQSPLTDSLQHIDISNNTLRAGVHTMFELGQWVALRHFNASGNPLTSEDIWALAHSPYLHTMQTLKLSRCRLTTEALRWLFRAESLAGLRTLDLSGNPLDLNTANMIASCPSLAALEHLDLMYSGCDTSEDCRRVLSNSPHLHATIRAQFD